MELIDQLVFVQLRRYLIAPQYVSSSNKLVLLSPLIGILSSAPRSPPVLQFNPTQSCTVYTVQYCKYIRPFSNNKVQGREGRFAISPKNVHNLYNAGKNYNP